MKATRQEVFGAIDSERAYQDAKWNDSTTTSGGLHSLEEWCVYMRTYLTMAEMVLSTKSKLLADTEALATIRKITAMGISCMEQHGAPRREGY